MERKIGEVFEHQGVNVKVVATEFNNCGNCCFLEENAPCSRIRTIAGECLSRKRTDKKSVIFVEVNDEQPQEQAEQPQDEQPQKLNLCEILKHCPKGEKFWSPMFGYVVYRGIIKREIGVTVASGVPMIINADGTLTINLVTSPEIMLYPSREQRDWTKVKYEPKKEKFDPKTLKPFDKVLSRYDGGCWSANLFSHIEEENNKYHSTYSFVCNGSLVKFCIPYNAETKHLVGKKDEAPEYYRYWED